MGLVGSDTSTLAKQLLRHTSIDQQLRACKVLRKKVHSCDSVRSMMEGNGSGGGQSPGGARHVKDMTVCCLCSCRRTAWPNFVAIMPGVPILLLNQALFKTVPGIHAIHCQLHAHTSNSAGFLCMWIPQSDSKKYTCVRYLKRTQSIGIMYAVELSCYLFFFKANCMIASRIDTI